MKHLITGLGSIGCRHAMNILKTDKDSVLFIFRTGKEKNLYCERLDNFIAREKIDKSRIKFFYDLKQALKENPDTCFITNPTSQHISTALEIVDSCPNFFMEKPISHNLENVDLLIEKVKKKKGISFVGYDLRFHPVIKKVKELLDKNVLGKILYCRAESGSYLPEWRPGIDYSKMYSAKKELGGGVLLDMSHELDYIYWFFGMPKNVFAHIDKISSLKIETEDFAELLLSYDSGMLCNVHLDYFQREPRRNLLISGEKGSIFADLLTLRIELITFDKEKKKQVFNYEDTLKVYIDEISHFFECVKKKKQPLITLEDGKAVLEICENARLSSNLKKIVDF